MEDTKPVMPQEVVSEASKVSTTVDRETVEKMIQAAKDDAIRHANSKIDEQMQKAQDSFITIFGIFSSVLSFLTIEFQFLRTLSHVEQIVGFSFLLFALLLSFNLALDYMVARRFSQGYRTHHFLGTLIIVTLALGLLFVWRAQGFQR